VTIAASADSWPGEQPSARPPPTVQRTRYAARVPLFDELRRLYADAEVSLLGGREERLEAERALAAGDFFRARAAAHRLLERAPRSPVGLALLADACEGAGLDAELEATLADLAKLAGASADVWYRLARVRVRVGARSNEVREALVAAIGADDDPAPQARAAVRAARLMLVDWEIGEGQPARAEGWLLPLIDAAGPDVQASDVRRRRLAIAVARRARAEVERILAEGGIEPAVTDAAGQRLMADAALLVGDRDLAVRSFARAAILGDGAALSPLREALIGAQRLDAAAVRAAEAVIDASALDRDPLWRAALARARGDAAGAARAVSEALGAGADASSTSRPADRLALHALAIAARDVTLLGKIATDAVDQAILTAARTLESSVDASGEAEARAASDPLVASLEAIVAALETNTDVERAGWLAHLRDALVGRLLPPSAPAHWDALLGRLSGHARALGDLASLGRIELLAAERSRPVRLAIVGEFNAGKSTFVNALLGMDVAPTGILPTTAVAHLLRFGPDPIARARLRGGGARTVPPERLRALLEELGDAVAEVEVEVPFPYLRRVEIVDTPGFNAPDPEHAKIAMATLTEGTGGREGTAPSLGVDVALWLFDANQPLKTSERRVLEAITGRGIALLTLLNKVDRLSPDALEQVLTTFARDADEIGLRPWRPALAFSAKRAVAARIASDEAQLEASRFSPVRRLLEDELPAHGEALKERGLRRRALDVVRTLGEAAGEAMRRAAASAEERRSAAAAMRAEAAILERAVALDLVAASALGAVGNADARADERPHQVRRAMRAAMAAALAAFVQERDALVAGTSPTVRSYLGRRLAEHLERHAARALAELRPRADQALDALWIDVRAIAAGFAAGAPDAVAVPDAEGALARAFLSLDAERLRADAAALEARPILGAQRAGELAALAAELAR
jgi:GTP-binding protein EngB required for normal cell division